MHANKSEVEVASTVALPGAKFRLATLIKPELIGYFLVSVLALGVDMGCFMALIKYAGAHYLFATTAGFLLGVWVSYYASIRLVFAFRSHRKQPAGEFAIFLLVGVFGWAVGSLAIYILIEYISMAPALAKLSAAGVTFFSNFALRKFMLFNKSGATA